MTTPVQIAKDIYVIDSQDGGQLERTSIYVIKREKVAIIDTCTSKSVPAILAGLEALHIAPEAVDYVILTHVHLDHAGGAGLLLQSLPNAHVYVHPKGARHIIDPTRLIESARSVYGEKFDDFFDPIVPIPEHRVTLAEHKTRIPFGEAALVLYDTPGHARHHISIYDEVTNSMFIGDTAGVQFPAITRTGYELVLPSTSPNQYNPEDMEQSMQFYESLALQAVFLGHYAAAPSPQQAFSQVRYWTPIWLALAEEAMQEEEAVRVDKLSHAILRVLEEDAEKQGYTGDLKQYVWDDVVVSSQGLIDYYQKK